MILVDIYVPSFDKTYDFQVDERVPVDSLIVEIAEMIGNATKSGRRTDRDKFFLCNLEKEQILPGNASLQACGVKNGSRLMLV